MDDVVGSARGARHGGGPTLVEIAAAHLREMLGGPCTVLVHQTWGDTLVVEAALRDSSRALVLKASGGHDVLAEARTAVMAADGGVPTPRVIASGVDDRLPGGNWFAMTRAAGVPWISLHGSGQRVRRLVVDIAACLRKLHAIHPEGYGWLDSRGCGRYASWSAWLTEVAEDDVRLIVDAGHASADLLALVDDAVSSLGESLDRRPAGLLHGDLGDREVFVDASSLRVTALVDWGDAVIGDPLYELHRFVAGGPVGDRRPALFRPWLRQAHTGKSEVVRDLAPFEALYEAHNAIRNARWAVREAPDWIPALVDVARGRLGEVLRCTRDSR